MSQRGDSRRRVLALGLVLASVFWTPVFPEEPSGPQGAAAPTVGQIRAEINRVLLRLVEPLLFPLEDGKGWILEARASWREGRGPGADAADAKITVAWDRTGRHAIRASVPGVGDIDAAILLDRSWLRVSRRGGQGSGGEASDPVDVVFSGAATSPASGSPLERCRLWGILKGQAGIAVALAQTAPLPEGLRLERIAEGQYGIALAGAGWSADLQGSPTGGPIALDLKGSWKAKVRIERVARVPARELDALLEKPATPAREVPVDDDDLRWMLATAVDMLCEKGLWAVRPEAVPPVLPAGSMVGSRAVLVVRGTPEEMGREYGTSLKLSITSNVHRILHGIGLVETVRTGRWFPNILRDTWEAQRRYVPERFIREMEAVADATGLRREQVLWTNIFPEHFHCSGIGLRGTATEGGVLMHGRILDYMTEVGLQATAVTTVHVPRDGYAWVNIGYAGCVGSVTGMNARGLAMGEMGGRGEGHIDGIPMTFFMREILERFETTQEALAWIRSVPRTCEYFYVLSDAKTKSMVGLGSWAKSLARERGTEDLLVLEPGTSHPLLPDGVPDAVLMSAGDRYRRLVDRVKARHGKISPQDAWDIMGEGVAMKSALHIALFFPESLDFWVAEASLAGRAAYTQPVTKLNLRDLVEKPSPSALPGSPAARP